VDYALLLLRKTVPRILRAMLGCWIVIGPFVVFLMRWEVYNMLFEYLLLVGAFVFLGVKCWHEGPEYIKRVAFDSGALISFIIVAGAFSLAVAKLIHVRLPAVLFLPLVVVGGFMLLEYYYDRKVLPQSIPANTPQGDS